MSQSMPYRPHEKTSQKDAVVPSAFILGHCAAILLSRWRRRRALRRQTFGANSSVFVQRRRVKLSTIVIRLAGMALVNLFTPPIFAADLVFSDDNVSVEQPLEEPADASGFYFGSRMQLSLTDDTSFSATDERFDTTYEPTFAPSGVVGYTFGPLVGPLGARVELQAGSFNTAVDEHTIDGAAQDAERSVGSLTGLTGTVNGFVDVHLDKIGIASGTPVGRLTPFAGGGVGVARVGLEEQGTFGTGVVIDDTDTAPLLHLSAGVGINLTERTRLELGYRHEVIPGLSFKARDRTGSDLDVKRNSLTFGLQRRF